MIVINIVLIQTLLVPFLESLGKTLWIWQSWQAVLNFSHIFIKLKNQKKNFQTDSNILASPAAGQSNCLPYVLCLCHFPTSQKDKYRNEKMK